MAANEKHRVFAAPSLLDLHGFPRPEPSDESDGAQHHAGVIPLKPEDRADKADAGENRGHEWPDAGGWQNVAMLRLRIHQAGYQNFATIAAQPGDYGAFLGRR